MKKFCVLLLCFAGVTAVQAKLSCEELDELATDLDDLAVALESVDSIGVDSELDDALGDVTTALHLVAKVEKDGQLSGWVADLDDAWEDMEREDFEVALDDITERLDELAERDCSDW